MTWKPSAVTYNTRFKLYCIGILKYRVRKNALSIMTKAYKQQKESYIVYCYQKVNPQLKQIFITLKSTQSFAHHYHLFLITNMLPSQLTTHSKKEPLIYSSSSINAFLYYTENCSICHQCPPEGILLFVFATVLCSAWLLLLLPILGVSKWETIPSSKLLLFTISDSVLYCQQ